MDSKGDNNFNNIIIATLRSRGTVAPLLITGGLINGKPETVFAEANAIDPNVLLA